MKIKEFFAKITKQAKEMSLFKDIEEKYIVTKLFQNYQTLDDQQKFTFKKILETTEPTDEIPGTIGQDEIGYILLKSISDKISPSPETLSPTEPENQDKEFTFKILEEVIKDIDFSMNEKKALKELDDFLSEGSQLQENTPAESNLDDLMGDEIFKKFQTYLVRNPEVENVEETLENLRKAVIKIKQNNRLDKFRSLIGYLNPTTQILKGTVEELKPILEKIQSKPPLIIFDEQNETFKIDDVYLLGNDFFINIQKDLNGEKPEFRVLFGALFFSSFDYGESFTKKFSDTVKNDNYKIEDFKKTSDKIKEILKEKTIEQKRDLNRLARHYNSMESKEPVLAPEGVPGVSDEYTTAYKVARYLESFADEATTEDDTAKVYSFYYNWLKGNKPELIKYLHADEETAEPTEEPEEYEIRNAMLSNLVKDIKLDEEKRKALDLFGEFLQEKFSLQEMRASSRAKIFLGAEGEKIIKSFHEWCEKEKGMSGEEIKKVISILGQAFVKIKDAGKLDDLREIASFRTPDRKDQNYNFLEKIRKLVLKKHPYKKVEDLSDMTIVGGFWIPPKKIVTKTSLTDYGFSTDTQSFFTVIRNDVKGNNKAWKYIATGESEQKLAMQAKSADQGVIVMVLKPIDSNKHIVRYGFKTPDNAVQFLKQIEDQAKPKKQTNERLIKLIKPYLFEKLFKKHQRRINR